MDYNAHNSVHSEAIERGVGKTAGPRAFVDARRFEGFGLHTPVLSRYWSYRDGVKSRGKSFVSPVDQFLFGKNPTSRFRVIKQNVI